MQEHEFSDLYLSRLSLLLAGLCGISPVDENGRFKAVLTAEDINGHKLREMLPAR